MTVYNSTAPPSTSASPTCDTPSTHPSSAASSQPQSPNMATILSPCAGAAGQHVSIDLRLLPQLELGHDRTCKLSFGTLAVETYFSRTSTLSPSGLVDEVEICVAVVPPFHDINWFDSHVPVQILVLSGQDNNIVSMIHVGMFEYQDIEVNSLKRPRQPPVTQPRTVLQADDDDDHSLPVKRASTGRRSQDKGKRQMIDTQVARVTPPLTPLTPHDSPFIFVQDDFDNILAAPWTDHEIAEGRRIVELLPEPNGANGFICRCNAVPDAEVDRCSREGGQILVSCIYWPSENQFIITGVDIIYAMEQLLKIEYSTEKKNRVRRNLEKFDPRTISKSNPQFFDFFWKIMGYAEPKPRNIEANVKVYPWVMVTEALRRILEKFGPGGSFKARTSAGHEIFKETHPPNASSFRFSPKLSSSSLPSHSNTAATHVQLGSSPRTDEIAANGREAVVMVQVPEIPEHSYIQLP
eukprot:Partr_v1_DN25261_c0_g1_i2_m16556 putative regulator medusa